MISRSDLQQIGQLGDDHGLLLSVYLALQPGGSTDHNIVLKNLLRDASDHCERTTGSPPPESMNTVMEEIRLLARDDSGRFGRGMAVFATPEAGVRRAISLPGSVEPSVSLDLRADLAPLIRIVEDYRPYCTCLVSRDHARMFLGQYDEIREHASVVDDDVPGQHDQGGWSQSRYERHIEDHVHRHFKHIAEALFELHENGQFEQLILAGPEEVVAGFKDVLHPYLQERLIGDVRLLMEANINDVLEQSRSLIDQSIHDRKGELVDSIDAEARAHDLGTGGLRETLEALQQGQVMHLVVDASVRASGVVCDDCGALATAAAERNVCHYCGGSVREVENIMPRLITMAFEQGATVSVIDDDEQRNQLARLGGVGALLRFKVEQRSS